VGLARGYFTIVRQPAELLINSLWRHMLGLSHSTTCDQHQLIRLMTGGEGPQHPIRIASSASSRLSAASSIRPGRLSDAGRPRLAR